MTAQIISMADRRQQPKVRNFSSPSDSGERTLLERIQQIADNLGIDVEAPFRRKPAPKGGAQ